MQTIGVPADVPSIPDSSGRYFFAIVAPTDEASVRAASTSSVPQVSNFDSH